VKLHGKAESVKLYEKDVMFLKNALWVWILVEYEYATIRLFGMMEVQNEDFC
jgi:hypothetical protein